jgi:hypothetical protein
MDWNAQLERFAVPLELLQHEGEDVLLGGGQVFYLSKQAWKVCRHVHRKQCPLLVRLAANASPRAVVQMVDFLRMGRVPACPHSGLLTLTQDLGCLTLEAALLDHKGTAVGYKHDDCQHPQQQKPLQCNQNPKKGVK